MSRFIEREAKEHEDDPNIARASVARLLITVSERYRKVFGEIELPTEAHQKLRERYKPVEITDLEEEWLRQVQEYVDLGFHTELDLTEEEYLDSLPKFEPQPESFRGRFDIPVLVETRISPVKQARLANVKCILAGSRMADWDKDPKEYKTPDKPYTTWMNDGKLNFYKSASAVRKVFAEDERGATIHDGIALFIAYPNILEDHFIDLPGTKLRYGYIPYLDLAHDEPTAYYHPPSYGYAGFGSATCGRV